MFCLILAAAAALPTSVVSCRSLPEKTTAVGVSRAVWDGPSPGFVRFEMHVTTLNPGAYSHPPHHHPWEEMLLLREGSLAVTINGRTQSAAAGSLIFFASHDVHNVRNVGAGPATYYVINFHTEATARVRDQPAAQWAPADRLRSSVVTWQMAPEKPVPPGVRRTFVDAPTLTFAHLEVHASTLPPGAPPSRAHRHPWGVLTIVRSGALELNLDGVAHHLDAGDFAYLTPNTLQFQRNAGPDAVSYFVISVTPG